jgi:hypothetical protein
MRRDNVPRCRLAQLASFVNQAYIIGLQDNERVDPEFAAMCDCLAAAAMTVLTMLPDVGSRALHAHTVGMVPGVEHSAVQTAVQAHAARFGAHERIPLEGACSDIRAVAACRADAAGAAGNVRGTKHSGANSSEPAQPPPHAGGHAEDESTVNGVADAVAQLSVADSTEAGTLGGDEQAGGGAKKRHAKAGKGKRVNTDEMD